MTQNLNSGTPKNRLDLSLRRDRGYIYFPDAIQKCIEAASAGPWLRTSGECYKRSSKEVYAEIWTGGNFNRHEEGLFGSVVITGKNREETWLLREGEDKNYSRYDLRQPSINFKFVGRSLSMNSTDAVFPTDFHRFAHLCAVLHRHVDGESGRRMLLQRIQLDASLPQPGEDLTRLDLMTKDNFMVFSLWRNGTRVGSLVGAARPPVTE